MCREDLPFLFYSKTEGYPLHMVLNRTLLFINIVNTICETFLYLLIRNKFFTSKGLVI